MKLYSLLRFFGHQEWIPFGVRYRLISLLVPFNTNFPFVSNFFSIKYKGNLNSYIDWQVYFFGAYEKKLLELLKTRLIKTKRLDTAFDIGANVGNHTLFLSTCFNQVHSFEPYELVSKQLNENIKLNNLKNVLVHPIALSNRNSVLPFSPPLTANKGTGSLSLDRKNDNEKQHLISVQVVKGDDFCLDHHIQNIDFIKLDVEGHEMEVFDGLTETIKKFKPIILFEYSPKYDSKRTIFESILEGYSFYLVKDSLKHISRSEILELGIEVNLLAEYKI